MLVSVKQLKKETNQSPEKKKGDTVLVPDEVLIGGKEKPFVKKAAAGQILGEDANLEKRREMIAAMRFEPAEFAYERAIGINDSLYSNFTELIALTKRKVGRIVVIENNDKTGYATGFMVSPTLMLTNWHVFKNRGMAEQSEVHFYYEYDVHGRPSVPVIFKFDTAQFFNNEELDYCFVALQPKDVTGKVSLADIGYLYLDKGLGKIGEVNVEKMNIIHHPQGDYKQISIRENLFVGIDETKIFYETDTAQGSSGSPVFNDQWQVVGLHHKSIAKMTADGNDYLDKDDNIIPIVNGKIDVTRVVWLRNEGMRISVILKHLLEQNPGNETVAGLDVPAPAENLIYMVTKIATGIETNNNNNIMANDYSKNITISVPADTLSNDNSIDISISRKKINATGGDMPRTENMDGRATEMLLEIAKAEKEEKMNFSKCKGYVTNFLGVNVPMPQPKKSLEKQVALLKNKENELKYFKHSVIFNAVTKMPVISAINVEGDAEKRLDDSKRSDDWLRDTRIDIECQLTDKFYSKSKFDKGHMSRFEDANWDIAADKALREANALRNAVYTCFYTNACPQVVALNRGAGIWGKLEKAVLEKGIKKETGKLARMTVFNGPIFSEDKDRIFRSETIPMEFFKIILWLDDAKKLKATAFKLSQEALVDHIKFDESMRIDGDEALDIDSDLVFKNYQCSIKSLSVATKIDFGHIEPFDTYKPKKKGAEEVAIVNEEEIML